MTHKSLKSIFKQQYSEDGADQDFLICSTSKVMRFTGSLMRDLREGAYALVPFLRPNRSSFVKAAEETHVSHSPCLVRTTLEDEGEQARAEIYARNFNSKSLAIRNEALDLIKGLSKPAAIRISKELLKEESNPLKMVQLLNVLSYLNKNEDVERGLFRYFLDHENPNIRLTALRAFSKYKGEEGFSALSSALRDTDAYVRRHALNLMCWTYRSRCEEAVFALLHDADNQVRRSAILICGALKLQRSILVLITLLSDPDKDIQKIASETLMKITKQNFGFIASSSQKNKDEAIAAWQSWWDENQITFGLQLKKEVSHGHL